MASAWIAALQSHDSAGTLFINTLGVKMDPVSGDGLNPSDLADACYDWFGASYRALLWTGLTFDSITVRKMPPGSGAEGVHAVGLAGTASGTDGNFPLELCYILSWKTDVATRSGRGHIAVPAPPITAITSSHNTWDFSSTYFATTVPAFLSALDGGHDWGSPAEGHLSHVVYSRKHDAYYDVKSRLIRSQKRWLERRQTAP